jgi:hypothetical protein
MNGHARQLASRREMLRARCEAERRQLAEIAQPLKSSSRLADRGLKFARYLRKHPVLTGIGIAAVVAASRGRLLRWIGIAMPIVGMGLRAGRALRSLKRP